MGPTFPEMDNRNIKIIVTAVILDAGISPLPFAGCHLAANKRQFCEKINKLGTILRRKRPIESTIWI
jgi:hypothetical protein